MNSEAPTSGAHIGRNTLINIAGAVAVTLLGMIILPFYLRIIGEELYGVLIILWVFFGYFGLFDFGLGRAVANQVARLARMRKNPTSMYWTAAGSSLVLGIVGGCLILATGQFVLTRFVNASDVVLREALATLPWLALGVPLITLSSSFAGALSGQERFLDINLVSVGGTALQQLFPLGIALWLGPSLFWLVIATLAARFLTTVAFFFISLLRLEIGIRPIFERSWIGILLRYGGWVTVSNAVSPILTTLDRLIIGVRFGAQYVTYYSVPYNLVAQATIIPYSLSQALFPQFSMLDRDRAHQMGHEVFLFLLAIMTPLTITGLVLAEPFLTLWVGAELAEVGAPVAKIILLGFWINSLAIVPYTLLQGQGRPDLTAKFHLVEIPPYLVMLWFGLVLAGLPGAAFAWTFRVSLDAGLLFWATHYSKRELLPVLAPGLLAVVMTLVALLFPEKPYILLALGLISTGISIKLGWHSSIQFRRFIHQVLAAYKKIFIGNSLG